jgi:hypothetical protein
MPLCVMQIGGWNAREAMTDRHQCCHECGMVKTRLEIVGRKFGRLTVVAFDSVGADRRSYFLCKCDCGNETVRCGTRLFRGLILSCGCLQREIKQKQLTTHGLRYRPEYAAYRTMIQRCECLHRSLSRNHGARGIRVCDRWRASFANFIADIGPRPTPQHSIDRIDNDGNYCPDNCKWATPTEQNQNKRNNLVIDFKGESRCAAEWERIMGFTPGTISRGEDMQSRSRICFDHSSNTSRAWAWHRKTERRFATIRANFSTEAV